MLPRRVRRAAARLIARFDRKHLRELRAASLECETQFKELNREIATINLALKDSLTANLMAQLASNLYRSSEVTKTWTRILEAAERL
jgi:hypothetical protein